MKRAVQIVMVAFSFLFVISTAGAQDQCPSNYVDGQGNGYVNVPPGLPGTQNGVPGWNEPDTWVGYSGGDITTISGGSVMSLSIDKRIGGPITWRRISNSDGTWVDVGFQGGNITQIQGSNGYQVLFDNFDGSGNPGQKTEVIPGRLPSVTRYTYDANGVTSILTDGGQFYTFWRDGSGTVHVSRGYYSWNPLPEILQAAEMPPGSPEECATVLDQVDEMDALMKSGMREYILDGLAAASADLIPAGVFVARYAPKLVNGTLAGAVAAVVVWKGAMILATAGLVGAFCTADIMLHGLDRWPQKYIDWGASFLACKAKIHQEDPCTNTMPPWPEIVRFMRNPQALHPAPQQCQYLEPDYSNYACWWEQASGMSWNSGG